MTDLLSSSLRAARSVRPDGPAPDGRSLPVAAALAGLGAAGWLLAGCMVLGLAGWFAADAGRYGDTRDALRVGTDAWLMAHGGALHLGPTTVSLVPLGLTLLAVLLSFRLGRWAAARAGVDDLRTALAGATVLSGVYTVVLVLAGVLASVPAAEVGLGRATLGGLLVSFLAGGAGLLREARAAAALPPLVGPATGSVLTAAAAAVGLVLAAGCLLFLGALAVDLDAAANVFSRLHTGVGGGLLYALVALAFVPNAVLLAAAYLLGPGFAVGTGTLVAPTAVALGPVPAFPLLAALPGDALPPAAAAVLLAVPVLLGGTAAGLAAHRYPAARLDRGAARGLLGGVLGGVVLGLLVTLAGGAAGPGRMAEVGAPFLPVLGAAVVALGAGGLVGGFAGTWWQRRRDRRTETASG